MTVKAFIQKVHIATLVLVIANQIHPSPFNCHAEMQMQRWKCITPQTRSLKMLHNMLHVWDTSHVTEKKHTVLNVKKQSEKTQIK